VKRVSAGIVMFVAIILGGCGGDIGDFLDPSKPKVDWVAFDAALGRFTVGYSPDRARVDVDGGCYSRGAHLGNIYFERRDANTEHGRRAFLVSSSSMRRYSDYLPHVVLTFDVSVRNDSRTDTRAFYYDYSNPRQGVKPLPPGGVAAATVDCPPDT